MKILITGGSTLVPIDQVRAITNIFKGRTGAAIAEEFSKYHETTLIGNPAMKNMLNLSNILFLEYKTYDELYELMEKEITSNNYDVVIHSAAVSDYKVGNITSSKINHDSKKTCNTVNYNVNKGGKISSSYNKLYLELIPTEKIIDKVRDPWGFKGKLVKFKLQVGMTDGELIKIARKSRITSDADIIVANCLEWSKTRAYMITDVQTIDITRKELPSRLLEFLEALSTTPA